MTIRHRRNAGSASSQAEMTTEEEIADDLPKDKREIEPLLSSSTTAETTTTTQQQEQDDEHNDGYILTPLIQRSVWMRWDVGPYALVYGGLIYVDCHLLPTSAAVNNNNNNILLQPITWLFALVIASHLLLVLMQQWNVHTRAWVGYQKATTTITTNKKTAAHQTTTIMASWTHCLVEGGESGSNKQNGSNNNNNKSADATAGIALVKLMQSKTTSQQQQVVAVVEFHDICFRCPVFDRSLDEDVTIWKSNTTAATFAATTAATAVSPPPTNTHSPRTHLTFHRVRFPVHLPVSFYGTWKGHTSVETVVQCQRLYGTNATILELPTFGSLLGEQIVAPFFLFQMFCVALWSLDEYWYYAIFTLLALLSFESTVAYTRQQGLQRLRNASRQNNQHRVWVHRTAGSAAVVAAKRNTNNNNWMQITVQEIVPGDLISLSDAPGPTANFHQLPSRGNNNNDDPQHNTVPADILLLKGNAVVDEALLTGESIPQIKVPFDPSSSNNSSNSDDDDDKSSEAYLDIQEHKEAMLYGGTVLLTADFGDQMQQETADKERNDDDDDDFSAPPDGGVVGIVLRTGFETAQGSLLRTIAHSSKSVDGVHTLDTFIFIFMLLCCAIASASLVLRDGWEDDTRNRFRLVLHVIIIITSVVPPELPMELSLAITNSVADLMRRCQVFCTEHYRIPWAGLVDVCALDKTGTITSDQMRLKGIRLFLDGDLDPLDEETALVKPGESDPDILPWNVVRVMAGCHSLALRASRGMPSFKAQVIGDPLEQAVLKDTGYQLVGNNMLIPTMPMPDRPKSISILHRFAFASALKRMTVLVTEEDSATDSNMSTSKATVWALTKGAPETIYKLLSSDSIPSDYDEVYTYHMSRGRRVLAMAYRSVDTGRSLKALKDMGRDKIECNLIFAGFLVLDCPLKPDSKAVISEIRKSDHRVVMITGDAVLTAAEVSRQCGIVSTPQEGEIYWLQELQGDGLAEADNQDPLSRFAFVPLMSSKKNSKEAETKPIVTARKNLPKLQAMMKENTAAFCLTGDVLAKVAAAALTSGDKEKNIVLSTRNEKSTLLHPCAQNAIKELVQLVSVFARHTPHQKEAVVAAFNLSGHYTLYCGDGTNDTPSLKRAHVGISIISAPGAESKQRKANASLSKLRKQQRKDKKAKKSSKNSSRGQSVEESLRLLREAQEEIDQIELGDASVASPFTSRQVSIVCCKNVIQQGRCTLVTMLQIYKILGINCLVNAMVLSTLSIHGVKQGDRQLTVLGTVVAALFFFVTRAKPLETLSPTRPPSSVLCIEALLSIALQFGIHFAAIMLACTAALSFVDPFDPSIVADGPFNPNVLNTCTFLLTVLATVNTFAVNYRGRPFTEDLRENKLLVRSLGACYLSLFLCAFEAFPPLNDLLQLSPFPETSGADSESFASLSPEDEWFVGQDLLYSILQQLDFPTFMCILMVVDTGLSFLVEKVIVRTFEG